MENQEFTIDDASLAISVIAATTCTYQLMFKMNKLLNHFEEMVEMVGGDLKCSIVLVNSKTGETIKVQELCTIKCESSRWYLSGTHYKVSPSKLCSDILEIDIRSYGILYGALIAVASIYVEYIEDMLLFDEDEGGCQ